MLENDGTCEQLCVVPDVPPEDVKFINDRIQEDYALNWLVDGLPAAEIMVDLRTGDTFYDAGFNLGNNEEDYRERPALNNHYEIVLRYALLCRVCASAELLLRYHKPTADTYRVVGVNVWPSRYTFYFLWINPHPTSFQVSGDLRKTTILAAIPKMVLCFWMTLKSKRFDTHTASHGM